jgi:TRAP-type C4-dicarboxylate transport system permease small subunit
VERAIVAYERVYRRVATYLVFLPLLAMTLIEFLNAIGRKLFVPFPGTIESVESLLVVSVYFGVALVALEGGHVNVTIGSDRLPPGSRHLLDALANLLAALVFGLLAGGAAAEAARSIALLEFRLGVYRFPLWPFKTLFAAGLVLLTVQLLLNTVKHLALARGREAYAGLKREESRDTIAVT